jgi:asparaginyl-tRNA synthetase
MTTRTKIKEVLKGTQIDQTVNVKGWVRTFRNNSFIAINDGSCINNIQAVVNFETFNADTLKRLTPGACIGVTGKLIASQGKGQTCRDRCV